MTKFRKPWDWNLSTAVFKTFRAEGKQLKETKNVCSGFCLFDVNSEFSILSAIRCGILFGKTYFEPYIQSQINQHYSDYLQSIYSKNIISLEISSTE